jgi:hypothetical protein
LQSVCESELGDDRHARREDRNAQVGDIDAVKQRDAWVVRQIAPDELMRARVVELEYAKIPRPLQLLPDEIVRRGLDDDVDVVMRRSPSMRPAVPSSGLARSVWACRNQAMRISSRLSRCAGVQLIDLALLVSIA